MKPIVKYISFLITFMILIFTSLLAKAEEPSQDPEVINRQIDLKEHKWLPCPEGYEEEGYEKCRRKEEWRLNELLALTVVCIIGIAVITTFFYDRKKRSQEIEDQSKK